jgi:hypothetical protein
LKSEEEILTLRWVRIFDPVHIPKEYVDQVKDKSFTTEKFYKFQETANVENINGRISFNPYNLLFVLVNESNHVKGFLWAVVDGLSNALVINTFSMDKDYWGNGKAVKLLESKAKEIKEIVELDKVYWITRCPKHSEKYGFKRSKNILMEYEDGQDSDGEQRETSGESQPDEPPTTGRT